MPVTEPYLDGLLVVGNSRFLEMLQR